MNRRVLNILAALSLLLGVVVAVLWVRGVGYSLEVESAVHLQRHNGPHPGLELDWCPHGGLHYVWSLPYWQALALSFALPLLRASRVLRRRAPAGRCVVCGYDLRATPERCPECGHAQ